MACKWHSVPGTSCGADRPWPNLLHARSRLQPTGYALPFGARHKLVNSRCLAPIARLANRKSLARTAKPNVLPPVQPNPVVSGPSRRSPSSTRASSIEPSLSWKGSPPRCERHPQCHTRGTRDVQTQHAGLPLICRGEGRASSADDPRRDPQMKYPTSRHPMLDVLHVVCGGHKHLQGLPKPSPKVPIAEVYASTCLGQAGMENGLKTPRCPRVPARTIARCHHRRRSRCNAHSSQSQADPACDPHTQRPASDPTGSSIAMATRLGSDDSKPHSFLEPNRTRKTSESEVTREFARIRCGIPRATRSSRATSTSMSTVSRMT